MVEIAVGDKCGDPVFYISDLLPHLAKDQMSKTMSEGVEGESLNILIGSLPLTIPKHPTDSRPPCSPC